MFEKFNEEWLLYHYRPIRGADGETEGEDPAGPAGGEEAPEGSGNEDPEAGSGEGEGEEESENVPEDADADELDRIRRERDEARERIAAAEAAARRAKQEAKAAREAAAKKDGNWEQIAKERETELAESQEARSKAETEAYEAKEELDRFRREVRVTRLASRLFFKAPEDALALLSKDATGDDKSCERALRKLADDKPYLVDQKRARGRALSGNGSGSGSISYDQLKNMSEEEINRHWPQVSASLSRGGGG